MRSRRNCLGKIHLAKENENFLTSQKAHLCYSSIKSASLSIMLCFSQLSLIRANTTKKKTKQNRNFKKSFFYFSGT